MTPQEIRARWQKWRFRIIRQHIFLGKPISPSCHNLTRSRIRLLKLARDLRGIDLSGSAAKTFVSYDFSGRDLSYANLSGCNLSSADLSGCNLSSADLSGCNLSSADLSGCNLSSADLSGCNLSYADLSRCDLTCANLQKTILIEAKLTGTTLAEVDALDADLKKADCRNANFYGSRLIKTNLQEANLRDAGFENALLHHVRLNNAIVRDSSGFVQQDSLKIRWIPDLIKVIMRYFLGESKVPWRSAIRDEREGDFHGAAEVYFQLYGIVAQAGRKDEAGELFYRWRCCVRKSVGWSWSRLLPRLYDSAFRWWLTGYGERIWRPCLISLLFIFFCGIMYNSTIVVTSSPGVKLSKLSEYHLQFSPVKTSLMTSLMLQGYPKENKKLLQDDLLCGCFIIAENRRSEDKISSNYYKSYFKFSNAPKDYSGDLFDWIYYSAVTFATLGYGDIGPNFEVLKDEHTLTRIWWTWLPATEAILGAALMSIFAAVAFRKIARS